MSKLSNFKIENTDIHHSITTDQSDIGSLRTSHCHDRYEILYVVSGTGRCIVEGNELLIEPGTLILTSPFEYHHVEINPTDTYERWCIHFPKDYPAGDGARILDAITKYNEGNGNFYPPCGFTEKIASVFKRIDEAQVFPERQKDSYIKLLISEILVFLSLLAPQETVHIVEELGARVIRYLNENLHRDVSLDTLAKKFFVSKYYLCRTFKKYSGVSIHGYVNYKRIVYAKHLIDSGEPASVAAYTVGFGDYSAFYRAYVKVIGSAPTKQPAVEQNTQDE